MWAQAIARVDQETARADHAKVRADEEKARADREAAARAAIEAEVNRLRQELARAQGK